MQMNIKPWGKYVTGITELIAVLLILYKPTTFTGVFLILGVMSGAIFSHLFVLGIEIKNDNRLLFVYALVVSMAALILLWLNRQQMPECFNKILKRRQGS